MMILTESKIDFYKKINGDLDARIPSKYNMTSDELYLIKSLLQDISLMKRNMLGEQMIEQLMQKLEQFCDSDATKEMLISMGNIPLQ